MNFDSMKKEEYTSKSFINKMAQKKVEIKEIMDELPSTELKFINKRWLDEVDNIENSFLKYLGIQQNIEELFFDNCREQSNLQNQIQIVKDTVGEKIIEIESLQFEKGKLLEIVKDEGLEVPEFDLEPVESIKDLKGKLREVMRDNKKLQNILEKESIFEQSFFETFIPFNEKYSNINEIQDGDKDNKNYLLVFIRDLLNKMEEDNRWLLEKVEGCEKINEELIDIEKD